jgi:hypothetical protein
VHGHSLHKLFLLDYLSCNSLSTFLVKREVLLFLKKEKERKHGVSLQFKEGMDVERFDGMRGKVIGIYELLLIVLWEDNKMGEYHLANELPPYYLYPIDL